MELLDQQLSRGEIEAAAARIRAFVRRTPVLVVDGADLALPGIRVAFKLEFTQHAGIVQGARRLQQPAVARRPGRWRGCGLRRQSRRGGRVRRQAPGVSRHDFCARTVASRVKIEQIRASGATLEISGERYADALAASEEFAQRSGALRVHAFDQMETLLGQATVGVEFEQDGPALDALLVAVGGGGLIGGIAAWYRGRVPVIGVEPEEAPQLTHALAAGAPVDAPTGGIAADSLAPRRVGGLMFPIAQRFVAETVLVSDEAIRVAQRTLWHLLRVVVEPGGAAAFAALQSGAWTPSAGQTIGVLLCGANTTAVSFE